ncbi:hypothetical protein Trydic_g3548 [Trypoxylus dichotomus]
MPTRELPNFDLPEKSLILKRMRSEQGVMKVQCTAEGVFPQPTIILRSRQREISETEVKVREKGQLFDITASAVLPALQDPEEFSCEVRIPEANYTKRQETVFFPGELSHQILFFISMPFPVPYANAGRSWTPEFMRPGTNKGG